MHRAKKVILVAFSQVVIQITNIILRGSDKKVPFLLSMAATNYALEPGIPGII